MHNARRTALVWTIVFLHVCRHVGIANLSHGKGEGIKDKYATYKDVIGPDMVSYLFLLPVSGSAEELNKSTMVIPGCTTPAKQFQLQY